MRLSRFSIWRPSSEKLDGIHLTGGDPLQRDNNHCVRGMSTAIAGPYTWRSLTEYLIRTSEYDCSLLEEAYIYLLEWESSPATMGRICQSFATLVRAPCHTPIYDPPRCGLIILGFLGNNEPVPARPKYAVSRFAGAPSPFRGLYHVRIPHLANRIVAAPLRSLCCGETLF